MAVELAKVSLWLDAFTLGAPLSFLDHHLRCGNSLIGAMTREADEEMRRGQKNQLTFLEGPFVGLLRSAEIMRGIGMLADATMEQAQESAALFREFERAARPYKQLLDIYVLRDFGVQRAEEFLRLYGVEALQATPETLGSPYRELLAQREAMYRRHRFFHWDLEFPEMFIDLDHSTWKENPGFDGVVGNPPYDELSEFYSGSTREENRYFTSAGPFGGTKSGRINMYRLFLLVTGPLLRDGGKASYIVPMTILGDRFSLGVRKRLLETLHLETVEAFPQKDDPNNRVFLEAKQSTCILRLRNTASAEATVTVRTHPGRYIATSSPGYSARQSSLYQFTPGLHSIPLVSGAAWRVLEARLHPDHGALLESFASIYAGEICDNTANSDYITDDAVGPLILRGGNVSRYELLDDPKQGAARYLRVDRWLSEREASARGQHHLNARIGFQKGAAIDNWRRLIAAVIPAGQFCFDTIGYIPFAECTRPYAILALLNSALWEFRFSATSTTNHVNAYELNIIMVPDRAVSGVQACELERLALSIVDDHQRKQAETCRFLGWLEGHLGTSMDDLSGKTLITNYLGDYQKGEGELPWDEFLDRLQRNRSKIRANLSDPAVTHRLRQEYEASLATLLPIKQRLKDTDWLIDQIVYKLYGLTEEEIAIVEGRS